MKKENQIFYTIGGNRWENEEPEQEDSEPISEQIVSMEQMQRRRGQKRRGGHRIPDSEESLEERKNIYGLDMYLPHGKRDCPGGMVPKKKRTVIRIRQEVQAMPEEPSQKSFPKNKHRAGVFDLFERGRAEDERAFAVNMGQAQKGRKEPGGGVKAGSRNAGQERSGRGRKGGGSFGMLIFSFLILLAAFGAGIGTGWCLWGRKADSLVNLAQIQAPVWIEQDFIRKNIYSRPAVSLRQVNDIVIHYVANPGSTAQQNRTYFDGLADQGEEGVSASAHFVIGLEGEIIQCIPVNEIAYASNNRNGDSIAIECCHPDETGEFTDATYESLVKLTAWLCDETGAGRRNIIRHYDITNKACPKYFVDHEDAWKEFKKDVKAYQGDWEE